MPCAPVEVDRLAGIRDKRQRLPRFAAFVRGHDHEKRMLRHRDKALRTGWVPLHQIKLIG